MPDRGAGLAAEKRQAAAGGIRPVVWTPPPRGLGGTFLGFNVRRYRGGKLLIKPSTAAVKRIRRRLVAEVRSLLGSNADAVIRRLNPIIRGWAAYYPGLRHNGALSRSGRRVKISMMV